MIKKKLEYFVDTWHIILHDVEEYFAMCTWNKNKKDEHNMFTTKNYVSIQTLLVHNREVCVNQNTTYSSPRGMFPLGIETI
jgi:hypothetical protein